METVVFSGIPGSGKDDVLPRALRRHARSRQPRRGGDARPRGGSPSSLPRRAAALRRRQHERDRARAARYVREAGFGVVGLLFEATTREAIGRQKGRPERERIPVPAILRLYGRLERPRLDEGFDELYRVTSEGGRFSVERIR